MASRPKHYFLAPTGHPPEGPIQLGNLISAPHLVDDPINECHIPIPPADKGFRLVQHDERNYNFSNTSTKGGKIGLWASFLINLGIGADIHVEASRTSEESWECDNLKTVSMTPTLDYINQCLQDPGTQNYLRLNKPWLRSTRLYMIIGVKVACGATSTVRYAEKNGLHLNFGVDLASLGVPSLQLGPELDFDKSRETMQSSTSVEPFVFAFRLRKIKITAKGDFRHEGYSKGAMLDIETDSEQSTDKVQVAVEGLEEDDVDGSEFRESNDAAADDEGVPCTYTALAD